MQGGGNWSTDMERKYLEALARFAVKEPNGWQDDPRPMRIAKLDDAVRKAKSAQK